MIEVLGRILQIALALWMLLFFVSVAHCYWRAKKMNGLLFNALEAFQDVDMQIAFYRSGDIPLTSEQALNLYSERRYLHNLIQQYEQKHVSIS